LRRDSHHVSGGGNGSALEVKTKRWNHNLHYHPLVLAAAPPRCARALDVGCGEGVLARELRSVSERVVGIDLDAPSIESARAQGGEGVEYVRGDFLAHPFEPASFDLVASVAALHHMDAETALTRMADLLRPGGTLVVVGLARSGRPGDFALDVAGAVATRVHTHVLGKRYWEHDAPKLWPPPLSYAEVRRTAARLLPGVEYRRHVLWRYSLVWRRPGGQ
jgi:SAM-dependent methyltransferase